MAGLFQKARVAALSSAHALLDKVIDLNSVGAVKQYVRDLESALDDLQDAAATEAGHVRTVQRDSIQIQSQMKELNQNIDFILSDNKPDNDHLAKPLEARLIGLEQRSTAKNEELDSAQKSSQALNEAVSTLQAKYQSMVEQMQRLEAMDTAAKAKEGAAQAIRNAGRITSGGTSVSVDDIADRIQRRSDVADAKFEQAMGTMSGQVEKDVVLAQAEARLEQRKARLAVPGAAPKEIAAGTPEK
jgi:phage shock protein A